MSQQALEYVRSLDRTQVTWKQKSLLKVIAEHHKCHLGGAYFPLTTLMEETLTDRSNLQKHLARLVALRLIEYTPGRGPGNYSQFRFRALDPKGQTGDGEKAVVKAVAKAVILRSLIRKEDPNQDQTQRPEAFDFASAPDGREEFASISSSPDRDDDIERVIQVFLASPVTKATANPADRATAQELIEVWSFEQIEYGILLASARIVSGGMSGTGKVQSLAYFKNAIIEASTDPKCNAGYREYLRHRLKRAVGWPKMPQGVVAS